MKALLIADLDATMTTVSRYIKPYGFDTIHYRSAVKAIDNIEEIAPDAVFISTGDFPRHWKTIVQFIRADTDKDTTVIILLINNRFSAEDADKAVHIGVQAIIGETLSSANDEKKLVEVFSRYRHIGPEGIVPTIDNPGARAVFLFTNPVNDVIITGKVESLDAKGLRFRPDAPSATAELVPGELMDQCSLKLDDDVLAPACRIVKNTNLMILEFDGLATRDASILEKFISESVQERQIPQA
jgi:hypothetical protein